MINEDRIFDIADAAVEEFNEYCREMTTGELDGVPAKELAYIFERVIAAALKEEREEVSLGIKAIMYEDDVANYDHELLMVNAGLERAKLLVDERNNITKA